MGCSGKSRPEQVRLCGSFRPNYFVNMLKSISDNGLGENSIVIISQW